MRTWEILDKTEYTASFVEVLPTDPVIAIIFGLYFISTSLDSALSIKAIIFLKVIFIIICPIVDAIYRAEHRNNLTKTLSCQETDRPKSSPRTIRLSDL